MDDERKHYVRIERRSGPMIERCDVFVTPWAGWEWALTNALEALEPGEKLTVTLSVVQLTDAEFEDICEK